MLTIKSKVEIKSLVVTLVQATHRQSPPVSSDTFETDNVQKSGGREWMIEQ